MTRTAISFVEMMYNRQSSPHAEADCLTQNWQKSQMKKLGKNEQRTKTYRRIIEELTKNYRRMAS